MAPMRGLSYTSRCLVTIDPVTSLMGYCLRPSKSGNFQRTKRRSQGFHSETPEGASLTRVRGTIGSSLHNWRAQVPGRGGCDDPGMQTCLGLHLRLSRRFAIARDQGIGAAAPAAL